MCGIIGYIGNQRPEKFLLAGLKKLQYRGYDSAGMALLNKKGIQTIKCTGKIQNLEEKVKKEKLIDSNIGIAHTRWATHGAVNEINAHPHTVGKITIVHNGIIENANEIKRKLEHEGYQFKSETDSEVVAALLDWNYHGDIIESICKSREEMIGSYALGILVEGDDSHLYATRNSSPLMIGLGKKEQFIASDILSFLEFTRDYYILEEEEIAILSKDEAVIVNSFGNKVEKELYTEQTVLENYSKKKFSHYMIKEIMEEPILLENILKEIIESKEALLEKIPDISRYEEIHIIGCGSALYAGMIGKNLIEEKAHIPTKVESASEYRYANTIYNRKTLVILISQSGETADTIAVLQKAKENHISTLGIVNVETSTIAKETDQTIFIKAGVEIAVATTKAYLLQVTMLSLLALKASFICGNIENEELKFILEEYSNLPKLVKDIVEKDYKELALQIYQQENIFFIGRQIDYAMCLEGSLKLKEVSYIHSEAYQAGELKHGTISLIKNKMPVIAIVTDPTIKDKTLSNVEEIKSRGAKCILITTKDLDDSSCDLKIVVDTTNVFMQPLLIAPILQLLAYETAKLRKCEIDYPKNLAKSVTVE